MDEKILISLCSGIALILGACIKPIFEFVGRPKESNNYITHQDFSKEKDDMYKEIEKRIEKATIDKASKESVENLQKGFTDLKKNVESKFDDFNKTLSEMAINIALLTERRKEPRAK